MIVAGGTILLTFVWWLPIVLCFGIPPYLSAAQTGLYSTKALLYLFISFSEEPFFYHYRHISSSTLCRADCQTKISRSRLVPATLCNRATQRNQRCRNPHGNACQYRSDGCNLSSAYPNRRCGKKDRIWSSVSRLGGKIPVCIFGVYNVNR